MFQYPPPPPGYYPPPPQYGVNSYVPCVFCHSTVPANAMSVHLSQCPCAQGAAMPTVSPTPFGSSQSVQYRRVVRVEKKVMDEHNLPSVPTQPSVQVPNRIVAKPNPSWALEDSAAPRTLPYDGSSMNPKLNGRAIPAVRRAPHPLRYPYHHRRSPTCGSRRPDPSGSG